MTVTGYDEVSILRDKDGLPIPQYYDSIAGVFKPLVESVIFGAGDGNRPVSGKYTGQGYFSIETARIWFWDGSDWVEVE